VIRCSGEKKRSRRTHPIVVPEHRERTVPPAALRPFRQCRLDIVRESRDPDSERSAPYTSPFWSTFVKATQAPRGYRRSILAASDGIQIAGKRSSTSSFSSKWHRADRVSPDGRLFCGLSPDHWHGRRAHLGGKRPFLTSDGASGRTDGYCLRREISTNLVNYIAKTTRTVELYNVKAILGDPKSPGLAEHSVDVVSIRFVSPVRVPTRNAAGNKRALRPGRHVP
jgi:hypothetical protein